MIQRPSSSFLCRPVGQLLESEIESRTLDTLNGPWDYLARREQTKPCMNLARPVGLGYLRTRLWISRRRRTRWSVRWTRTTALPKTFVTQVSLRCQADHVAAGGRIVANLDCGGDAWRATTHQLNLPAALSTCHAAVLASFCSSCRKVTVCSGSYARMDRIERRPGVSSVSAVGQVDRGGRDEG